MLRPWIQATLHKSYHEASVSCWHLAWKSWFNGSGIHLSHFPVVLYWVLSLWFLWIVLPTLMSSSPSPLVIFTLLQTSVSGEGLQSISVPITCSSQDYAGPAGLSNHRANDSLAGGLETSMSPQALALPIFSLIKRNSVSTPCVHVTLPICHSDGCVNPFHVGILGLLLSTVQVSYDPTIPSST